MGILRYYFAILIAIDHFNILLGYHIWVPEHNAVGGFFALSGFLVYGSYLRHGTGKFLVSRMRRLMPAYIAVVLLTALAFGLLSTLPLNRYFADAGFWKYLAANLTYLNFLHPDLPGVLEGYEIEAVNGALWTMKIEWMFFLSIPLIAWAIGKLKCRPAVMFISIYVLSTIYVWFCQEMHENTGRQIYYILSYQFFGQLRYFVSGVLIYFYFDDFMRYKWRILAAIVIAFIFGEYIPGYYLVLYPMMVAMASIWFSMVGKWGVWEARHTNISYNIYLVHFPVIQAFACIGPNWPPAVAFTAVFVVILAAAWFTSVAIERPVIARITGRR